ncbi:MAG: MFS transporter [Promethearchaeota archaeon]
MEKSEIISNWPFWPVVLLAIIYPINSSLINLAIPLYFFNQGVDVRIIGLLSSGIAITYCFSPIAVNKFSNKIGRKHSIMLACAGGFLAQLTYYFTLHPFVFLFSRIFEGLIMGFYWSSLQSSISDSTVEKIDTLMSRYNFSWNFGILSGFLIGFILLFSLNELLFIFYISPLFLLLMIIISTFFFKEPPKFNSDNFTSLTSHSLAIPPLLNLYT